MTVEIDPDLRLHTRLALGRGWRRATTVALWIGGLTLIGTGRYRMPPFFIDGARATTDPGFLQVALLLLMIAPARAVARLLDLERGGLLDQTRLCGRRPHRVLAAFIGGSTAPFVLLAAVLLVNHLRLGGQPAVLLLSAMLCIGALGVSLLTYGTLPTTMTVDSRFLTPLMFLLGLVAFLALRVPLWMQHLAFEETAARLTASVIAVVFPLGVWTAYRRVKHPRQAAARFESVSLSGLLSRLVPGAGPPEFNRHLRSNLRSGGTAVCLLAAPLVTLLAIRVSDTVAFRQYYKPLVLNGLPYALILMGAFAAAMAARREIESGTVDQVRLTPQSPLAVMMSWYLGLVLPFWIAALATMLTLRFAAPAVFLFQWPLVAFAILLPAVSIAEGFQRRRLGTYVWLSFLIAGLIVVFGTAQHRVPPGLEGSLMSQGLNAAERRVILTQRARMLPGGEWRAFDEPWRPQTSWMLLAVCSTALSLGAAAGRLRRAHGPALSGASSIIGILAVVFAVRQFPLMMFPRVLPGLLALLASFLAEERDVATSPWRRVGTAGAAVLVGVVLATRMAGVDWIGGLVTALAGACALGAGMIAHELLWRTPAVSLCLRLSILLALERWTWSTFGVLSGPGEEIPAAWHDLSPALGAIDIAALAALFGVAAFVHTRRRLQALA